MLSSGSCAGCMISHFSHVQLSAILRTVAHQAPLSMGFSRQEYWSGLPCLPPGIFLIIRTSLKSPALTDRFITISATCQAPRVSRGLNQSDSRAALYPEGTKAKFAFNIIQFVDRIFSLFGCKSEIFLSLLCYL